MNLEKFDSKKWSKWILFIALLFFVPAPFYMIVVGGLIPTIIIVHMTLQGLIVAIPKFTAEGFWMLGILFIHVLILGGILFLAAFIISWVLFRLLPKRLAQISIVAIVCSLVVASTFEIYRLPGHNSAPPANIVKVLKSWT